MLLRKPVPVTFSDTADLSTHAVGVLFKATASGNIKVTLLDGDVVTYTIQDFAAGVIHELPILRIHATGTTITAADVLLWGY